jgi:hypothetical protein
MSQIQNLRFRFGRLVVAFTVCGLVLGGLVGALAGQNAAVFVGGIIGVMVGGLAGLPGYREYLRQRRALLEQVGERTDLGPIRRRTGIGNHLRKVREGLTIEVSISERHRSTPAGMTVAISGLRDCTAVEADGAATEDALPASDGFFRIEGDRASLLDLLGAAGCERLYRGLSEHGWRLRDGVLMGVLVPSLWDVDELSQYVLEGLAMVTHESSSKG